MLKTLISIALATTSMGQTGTTVTPQEWTQAEQDRFFAQLKQGIQKSEEKYQQVWKNFAQNNQTFNPAEPLAAQAYETTVEVKSTLFSNFSTSDSVKDPRVRDILLKIFNKDLVTMTDLVELQDMVGKVNRGK
jgi:hypothetical protein